MRDKIWFMVILLGGVAAVAGLALAGVKEMTTPVIEQRELEQKIKPSLDAFYGPLGVDNDFIADRKELPLGTDARGRKLSTTVFPGKQGGKLVAVALQTAAGGFGGDIKVLSAFDLEQQQLLGVKTVDQKETKGLGARVADDSEQFIRQWVGMPYAGGVKLRANGGKVDAISGATVSSTGYTAAVNKATILLAERKSEVLGE
jgi:electron transport complex protein RnfG